VPQLPPAAGEIRSAEISSFQSELRSAIQPNGTGAAAGEGIQNPESAKLFRVSPMKAERKIL
jgi:hypothetical protein